MKASPLDLADDAALGETGNTSSSDQARTMKGLTGHPVLFRDYDIVFLGKESSSSGACRSSPDDENIGSHAAGEP